VCLVLADKIRNYPLAGWRGVGQEPISLSVLSSAGPLLLLAAGAGLLARVGPGVLHALLLRK